MTDIKYCPRCSGVMNISITYSGLLDCLMVWKCKPCGCVISEHTITKVEYIYVDSWWGRLVKNVKKIWSDF